MKKISSFRIFHFICRIAAASAFSVLREAEKTTILNLIAGIVPPDTGVITLPDGDVSVVFQEDRLLPWADTLHNVQLVLERSLPPKEAQAKALRHLKEVYLDDFAQKRPAELSRRDCAARASLARALAFGGSVLLLDEPFSGQDAQIKETLFPMFAKIKKDKTAGTGHPLSRGSRSARRHHPYPVRPPRPHHKNH